MESHISLLQENEREGIRLLQAVLNPEHAHKRLHPYYRDQLGKFLDFMTNNRLLLAKIQTLLQKKETLVTSAVLHPKERQLLKDDSALQFAYRYTALSTLLHRVVSGLNKVTANLTIREPLQGKEIYAMHAFIGEKAYVVRTTLLRLKAFGVQSQQMDHLLQLIERMEAVEEQEKETAYANYRSGVLVAIDGEAYRRAYFETLSRWQRLLSELRHRFLGAPVLGVALFYRDTAGSPSLTPCLHAERGNRLDFSEQYYLWGFELNLCAFLTEKVCQLLQQRDGERWLLQLKQQYANILNRLCLQRGEQTVLALTKSLHASLLHPGKLEPLVPLDLSMGTSTFKPVGTGVGQVVRYLIEALQQLARALCEACALENIEEVLHLPLTLEDSFYSPAAFLQYLHVRGWIEPLSPSKSLQELMGLPAQPPILVSEPLYRFQQKLYRFLKVFWTGNGRM